MIIKLFGRVITIRYQRKNRNKEIKKDYVEECIDRQIDIYFI